ncbi:MAG: hypothetical protein IKH26_05675 [Bacteroidaceae bacterium]|nr:hypothetical protein [Bacteroidaceae bacterium]
MDKITEIIARQRTYVMKKWECTQVRKLTEDEKKAIKEASVTQGDFGLSVCLVMNSGDVKYITVDKAPKGDQYGTFGIEDKVKLDTLVLKLLENQLKKKYPDQYPDDEEYCIRAAKELPKKEEPAATQTLSQRILKGVKIQQKEKSAGNLDLVLIFGYKVDIQQKEKPVATQVTDFYNPFGLPHWKCNMERGFTEDELSHIEKAELEQGDNGLNISLTLTDGTVKYITSDTKATESQDGKYILTPYLPEDSVNPADIVLRSLENITKKEDPEKYAHQKDVIIRVLRKAEEIIHKPSEITDINNPLDL